MLSVFSIRPLVLSVAAAFLAVSPSARPADADPVIGRVAGVEIKTSQVRPYLSGLPEADRAALSSNPALLSQTVRSLVLQQILFKEALATGWDKLPEIAAQLERLKQAAIADTYLQSISKIPEGYPSEADVKALYEARKADLNVPKQLRLAQIYIAIPPGSDKAAAEKAGARVDSIMKALKSADFADVARDQSDERESAARGGEAGWLAESQIQPEIRKRVSTMAKGSTTEPIRLGDGFYIVKVLDIRDAHTATLEEVKAQLIRALRTERARQNREAYLAKLQQQNPVALDELSLSKLLEAPAATPPRP